MIKLSTKQNVTPPSIQHPFGQIVDDDGSGNGTPVDKDLYQDHHVFFDKLMALAGITPNGVFDDAYNGFQLIDALMSLMGGYKTKYVTVTGWNMDTTDTINVPHGLGSVARLASIDAMVISNGGSPRPLNSITSGDVLCGGVLNTDNTNIVLRRAVGVVGFDGPLYNNASVRVRIQYTD